MIVFKLNIIKYHILCCSLSWDFNRCLVWKPRGSRLSIHVNGSCLKLPLNIKHEAK